MHASVTVKARGLCGECFQMNVRREMKLPPHRVWLKGLSSLQIEMLHAP
jgi:hypothetical protein